MAPAGENDVYFFPERVKERNENRIMNDYQIITDSTSDLTQEMVDELGVDVIPMDFTIGTDTYKDYPRRPLDFSPQFLPANLRGRSLYDKPDFHGDFHRNI
jgi:hypothetical protein